MKSDSGRLYRFFAVIQPGLEETLAEEIAEAGFKPGIEPGGVGFDAPSSAVSRLVLGLRCPGRLLLVVGGGRAGSADELGALVKKLNWEPFIPVKAKLEVSVSTEGSRLTFRDSVEKKVAWAIRESLKKPRVMELEPKTLLPQRVQVRIQEQQVTLSVDCGGELLHKRGWRSSVMEAPIRENVAAALLRRAGWSLEEALVDPFCGSGTFLIEAALWAKKQSPFTRTEFACKEWPALRKSWKVSAKGASKALPILQGSDRDPKAILAAVENAKRVQVEGVRWQKLDVEQVEAPAASGLLLCNPPYGERMIEGEAYRKLGRLLKKGGPFADWRAFFLAPGTELAESCARAAGRRLKGRGVFSNGGLKVGVWEVLV
jgi:putative N6-adenine-specific DNA methylase